MDLYQAAVSLVLGLALSACCGLRVFVPLLVAACGQHWGWLSLNENFQWLGHTYSIAIFAIAAIIEILAYKIPFLDNALDTITTPASIVAGTLLTAGHIINLDPSLRWTLALIVGGGSAGIIQLATTLMRGTSTTTTAGVANPFFATGESVAAIFLSVFALILPLISGIIIILVLFAAIKFLMSYRKKK